MIKRKDTKKAIQTAERKAMQREARDIMRQCIQKPDTASAILENALKMWKYDRQAYWLPLVSPDFRDDFDWFFIMENYIEEAYPEILDLLFQKSETIWYSPLYSIDKNIYRIDRCQFERFRGESAEYACFPEDLAWMYYRSHECTVAFAGFLLLPRIKKLLEPLKEHWNVYEGG